MHLKDGDELFIQGYARKLHPTSTETQSLTGSDPEWQIVAGPKKGKWNTGISLSIRSEEVLLEKNRRIFKIGFAVGLTLTVLLMITLLVCNFVLH